MTDTFLGKYQILEELGEGTFATVHRAVDTKLNREVALKILRPSLMDDPTLLARFQKEAQVTVQLMHPHIALLWDHDQIGERYALAMQYIPGGNLRDYVASTGPLPLSEVVGIITNIAGALDYAHSRDVLHRDLKPSNILMDQEGRAYLTDFGIAKALHSNGGLTMTTSIVATPRYASPEQAESKPLDGRSDLYALGVVAYELVTGSVPFEADTVPSLYYKIVHETPPRPSTLSARAVGPVEEVLLKAIAKDPADRFESGAALAAALKAAIEQGRAETEAELLTAAREALAAGDLDLAEAKAVQVLLESPRSEAAHALLAQVRERREYLAAYQALGSRVEATRAQAQALVARFAEHPDPEGVLALLLDQPASPRGAKKSKERATLRTSASPATRRPALGWWLLGAGILTLPVGIGLAGIIGAIGVLRQKAWGKTWGLIFATLAQVGGMAAIIAEFGHFINYRVYDDPEPWWWITSLALIGWTLGIVFAVRLKHLHGSETADGATLPPGVFPMLVPMFISVIGAIPALGVIKRKRWARTAGVLWLVVITGLSAVYTVAAAVSFHCYYNRWDATRSEVHCRYTPGWASGIFITVGAYIAVLSILGFVTLFSRKVKAWCARPEQPALLDEAGPSLY